MDFRFLFLIFASLSEIKSVLVADHHHDDSWNQHHNHTTTTTTTGRTTLQSRATGGATGPAPPCVEESVASMLCSPMGPRPNIALCLTGAARTFENVLVHRSLKENVIDRLGAPVKVFAFLKLGDARGDDREGFNAVIAATTEGVRRAAEAIGVTRLEIKEDSHNEPPSCPDYPEYKSSERCPGCHVNSVAHQQSLLGQLEGRAKCFTMITEHEKRSNEKPFDWVIVARPDLTWYDAVAPWCRHSLRKRLRDWTFWMPRADAQQELFDPWSDHYKCKTPPLTSDPVEAFVTKHTRLFAYRDTSLQQGRGSHTLPAFLTRFNAPGFPLLHCKVHLAIGDADADMRDAKCTDETSGNVCNAPLRAP